MRPVLLLLVLSSFAAPAPLRAEDEVRVSVVAILCSKQDEPKVDRRLRQLADHLQRKEPSWNCFEVERTNEEWIAIGTSKSFTLVDDCEAIVTFKERDSRGCITLLLHAPTLAEISYNCCCDKYFPVITGYETKDKKRLVIAVMSHSCNRKK